MDITRWHQVNALFDAVVDYPPAEQQARLAAAGAEPEVRAQVEALLTADREAPSFVDEGIADLPLGSWTCGYSGRPLG